MKRTNLYLTQKQVERLKARAEQEGLAFAELVRRAVDAFLAWDDPTYTPVPRPPHKERRFHSPHQSRGLSRPGSVIIQKASLLAVLVLEVASINAGKGLLVMQAYLEFS